MGSGYDDSGVWSVVGNGKGLTNNGYDGCDNNNGGVQVTVIPLVVVIIIKNCDDVGDDDDSDVTGDSDVGAEF